MERNTNKTENKMTNEDINILIDSDNDESDAFCAYCIDHGYDAEIFEGSGSCFIMDEGQNQKANELWDQYCNQ